MSNNEKHSGAHGILGALKQLVVHPAAKHLAEITINNPTIAAWIHANPGMAENIGKGLAAATGYFEIPHIGPILNEALEMFAAESMELLDKLAEDSGNPDLQKAVAGAVAKSVNKAAERGAFIVLEQVHETTDCITVATYVAEMTPPAFVDRKGGQPPRPQPSRARIVPTKLGPALMAGKPLCSICYPAGREGLKPHSTKGHDEAHATPSSKTVGEFYLEWLKTDEEKAKNFFKSYTAIDATMTHKFTLLFAKKGSLELLVSIAAHPSSEWSTLLDTMLGPTNRGITSMVDKFISDLGQYAKKEGEEDKNFLDEVEKSAKAFEASQQAKLAVVKSRRKQQTGKSCGTGLVLFSLALFIASATAGIIVVINHYTH